MSGALALPNIGDARLPVAYENARSALAECTRIDECAQWANKAEALASYAKQAKDEQLRKMADRIQARAIRRCGDLLKQIPDTNRGRPSGIQDGTVPNITRASAAESAGLSERQRKTALRVASVDAEAFERQVESDTPPTVTALAEQGKAPRPLVDLGSIPPSHYARATEAMGTLRRFAEFCQAYDPSTIAHAFQSHEVMTIREHVETIDRWLDVLVTSLPED